MAEWRNPCLAAKRFKSSFINIRDGIAGLGTMKKTMNNSQKAKYLSSAKPVAKRLKEHN